MSERHLFFQTRGEIHLEMVDATKSEKTARVWFLFGKCIEKPCLPEFAILKPHTFNRDVW